MDRSDAVTRARRETLELCAQLADEQAAAVERLYVHYDDLPDVKALGAARAETLRQFARELRSRIV